MSDIHKAAGIIIRDRKLLFEKSFGKEFYIAPGGKPKLGETSEQALVRELKEECSIDVKESDLEYFGTFSAEAINHPGNTAILKVYMVNKWSGDIEASNEVERLAWVASNNPEHLPIGSIFEHEVIPALKKLKLID
jgi:mutator protein MutT